MDAREAKKFCEGLEKNKNLNYCSLAEEEARKKDRNIPYIVIQIPAYHEEKVIEKTLKTISLSDYPKDRLYVQVLTEGKENEEKERNKENVVRLSQKLLTENVATEKFDEQPRYIRENSQLLVLDFLSSEIDEDFQHKIAKTLIANPKISRVHSILGKEVLKELFEVDLQDGNLSGKLEERLGKKPSEKIEEEIKQVLHTATEIPARYTKILKLPYSIWGKDDILSIALKLSEASCFPSKPLIERIGKEIEERRSLEYLRVSKEIIERIKRRFRSEDSDLLFKLLSEHYDNVIRTTPEIATSVSNELNKNHGKEFIHVLVLPTHTGYKAGALNLGIKDEKLKEVIGNVDKNDVVIGVSDADMLFPSNALSCVAYHFLKETEKNPVFQLPGIYTSNFHDVSSIQKIDAITYTIRSVGRWVRKLKNKEVDIAQGTGYFIPYNLLERIGGWDENTVCEDSRLLICNIYTMDKGKKRVKILPSFQLGQVPPNARAFFKQQTRWAYGGPADVEYLLKSPLSLWERNSDLTHTSVENKWKLLLTKYNHTLGWFVSHLNWSSVGFLTPTLLPVASYTFPLDPVLSTVITTSAAIGTASGLYNVVENSSKAIKDFLPYKLSRREKIQISFYAPFFGVVSSLPVAITQVKYLLKRKNLDWEKTVRT